ncbi:Na/Pi cotransporter family protein [Ruminiclostridium herbifermentans]|uniref:Na/Pi cotransporter family protein n=1 Tax=Ruminiclostridium herbifermentans TaxID=2488810 RepID=A0A4V6YE47_9FIRM|nr:Na/Pi cotransporter family protein [Ruminiclostridium herbifermentans]QNU65752.1 Na/Pi cotransporter family protein [Ruminiclostridium herbifermentans]
MEILMNLLLMLGGVAVFMFGMKQMSSGLERSAGSGIRNLFKKINKNSIFNYGIGVGATALVQSSSASSIMTVGLAHANIVTVKQGSGFILGAKVGTTLTAFIFALSGISKGGFSISSVFAAVAFVGVIIVFSTNNETLNKIAPFLIGFGMLFIGMEVMGTAIGGADSTLSIQLSKVFKYEIMQNPILLVILGILFTGIIQSSTAATGVFIAFLATGVINNIDQSFFLVMGANIGTCSDGIMASLSTNANGKRIALFHLLTSVIGAVSFSIILVLFRTPIINIFESLFPQNPQFSLATFNLIYNTIYTLVLLIFIDPLVNLVTRLVKDKQQKLEEVSYIDEHFLQTPVVAIEQALKEMHDMAILAKENIDRAYASLVNEDMSQSKLISDVEYRIDFLTNKLTNFFIKISLVNKFAEDEKLIGGLHHVTNDIERLGDYAVLMVKETNYMKENNVKFLDQTKEELDLIYRNICEMFNLGFDAFSKRRTENFRKISNLHKEIKKQIASTRDEHVVRLSSGMYPVEVSKSIYSVLFSLQRISDHIVNIAYSIRSTTGSKTEALQAIENERKKKENAYR